MVVEERSDDVSFDFRDKRVWVTGASRGLGRAIALGFARAGARVALTSRTEASLAGVRADLPDAVDRVMPLPLDISVESSVREAVSQITDAWGGIDCLVNCAGISPSFKPAENVREKEWRDVLDVNLTGLFLCTREAGQVMLDHGSGTVINVSSIAARAGLERMAAYTASKGAVEALTRTLALEWAERGVRVNCLAPGFFETDMTHSLRHHDKWRDRLLDRIPVGRFGEPRELVPAALFLASDASRYVTGTALVVDGGWTAA